MLNDNNYVNKQENTSSQVTCAHCNQPVNDKTIEDHADCANNGYDYIGVRN